jgi:2-keto-3-deoxy-L-rhamnonate aldolase RhmA
LLPLIFGRVKCMFYECNKILTMVNQKKVPLGIQCFTGSPALVEILGATGFDFVMFDSEHSANDARAMEELVRTATLAGLASYIRIPDPHNATDVTRALESGAEGLVLPEVHSLWRTSTPPRTQRISRPRALAASAR